MTPRICICCGEPMVEKGNALSRNPNVCASCSSLADGMEEPVLQEPRCGTTRLPDTEGDLSGAAPAQPEVRVSAAGEA